ncbi:uncharacterized protein DS421_1g12490 [Arachis hypogaea]|nr:uncharacterized protein DS421_1g12490 [Arachis hypogaea]
MIQTQKHSFIHRLHIPNKMLNKMLLVTLTLNRCNSWFLLYSRRSIPSLFVFLPTRFVVLFLCSSLLWFVVLVSSEIFMVVELTCYKKKKKS